MHITGVQLSGLTGLLCPVFYMLAFKRLTAYNYLVELFLRKSMKCTRKY